MTLPPPFCIRAVRQVVPYLLLTSKQKCRHTTTPLQGSATKYPTGIGENLTTAELMAGPGSTCLLLSFSPFYVGNPEAELGMLKHKSQFHLNKLQRTS